MSTSKTEIDLNTQTIQELTQLKNRAEELITLKQQEEIGKAVEAAKQIAASVNLTLEELFEQSKIAPKRVRKSVEPRYRSKLNDKDTWTGRGKQPTWLVNELQSGTKLEDLKIA